MPDPWEIKQPSAVHTRLLTKETPALAAHAGSLWCAWTDSVTETVMTARFEAEPLRVLYQVPALPKPPTSKAEIKVKGPPALGEVDEELHLMVRSTTGALVHYRYDDATAAWGKRTEIPISGERHYLASYNNLLYCVSVEENKSSYWGTWSAQDFWSDFVTADISSRKGRSSLFTWYGSLYFVGVASDSSELRENKLQVPENRWVSSDIFKLGSLQSQQAGILGITMCEGLEAIHLAATFGPDRPFTIYQRDATNWKRESDNIMYKTSAAPALVFLNNTISCLWAAAGPGELYLAQKDATPWGDLSSWMSHLDPATPITKVNLPGTHDACAANDWFPRVTCQRMTIASQLSSGIRYLDIRGGMADQLVSPNETKTEPVLAAFHGCIAIGSKAARLLLKDVLNTCYTFLQKNKTECLVLQVKCDAGNEAQFVENFVSLKNANSAMWSSETLAPTEPVPTIKQLAGKILLVRRFTYKAALGVDGTNWPANSGRLRIQDDYNVMTAVSRPDLIKFKAVKEHLEAAVAGQDSDWYINYSSAVAGLFVRGSTKLALNHEGFEGLVVNGVNGLLLDYLGKAEKRRYGTVVMDFADSPPQLIAALISTNRFAKP